IYSDFIVGISIFNNTDKSYYIPINHINYTNNFKIEDIVELFNSKLKDKVLIFHNLIFDGSFFRKYGFNPCDFVYFDTMIAAHLIDELRSCGLKNLSKQEFGYKMQEFDFLKKGYKNAGYVPVKDMYYYACDDAIITFLLFIKFRELLKKNRLSNLYYNIEMPFLEILINIKEYGIKFNLDLLNSYKLEIEKDIEELEQEIFKYNKSNQRTLFDTNIPFDINSNKQLGNFLFNTLKLPVVLRSEKTDTPLTGFEVLDELKGKHPVIDLLLKYKRLSKIYHGYILSLPKRVDGDGKIRTDFLVHITKTGRMCARNPNLQQLPNTYTEEGKKYDIRKCFIVEEHEKMFSFDYSQQELKIASFISNDKTMIDAYKKNIDIHLLTANNVYGLGLKDDDLSINNSEYNSIKHKYNTERKYSKGINFQIIYGAGPFSLSKSTNTTEEEAKVILDKYFETYKGIKQAIDKTHDEVVRFGYVTNYFGRIRHFPKANDSFKDKSQAFRESFNFKIQSFGAELVKLVSIEIFKKFKGTDLKILLFVHDEIVFSCNKENVEKYSKEIQEIMENTVKIEPSFVVELGTGDNYSEAK
ncbi:MAG: DNA polymerase, partial [Bacilli bacterium]|nr:DNA polymerase [Bacilli bacterium]